MTTVSPFLTPNFFNPPASLDICSYNSAYVTCRIIFVNGLSCINATLLPRPAST